MSSFEVDGCYDITDFARSSFPDRIHTYRRTLVCWSLSSRPSPTISGQSPSILTSRFNPLRVFIPQPRNLEYPPEKGVHRIFPIYSRPTKNLTKGVDPETTPSNTVLRGLKAVSARDLEFARGTRDVSERNASRMAMDGGPRKADP